MVITLWSLGVRITLVYHSIVYVSLYMVCHSPNVVYHSTYEKIVSSCIEL